MSKAALLKIATIWKSVKCTDKEMGRMHTMRYYSALEMEEILTHVTAQMDPGDMTLSEISQSQKDKRCVAHSEAAAAARIIGMKLRGGC